MRPLKKEGSTPTQQPLSGFQTGQGIEHQLVKPTYLPNKVPLGARFFYAIISLTWVGWSMIGLLSGHMFFLISKGGPIHFSGVPAILFSVAVMASAAACAVAIVDHYDKRNNEESYQRMRRRLWWMAFAFLCLSAVIGVAERTDVLPFTDSKLGLLSTHNLQSLLSSSWLSSRLMPYRAALDRWPFILLLWCFGGLFVLSKLGILKKDDSTHPGATVFMVLFLIGPAVVVFTLNLIGSLVSGSIPLAQPLSEESLRAQLAWLQSMLLTCISVLVFLAFIVVFILLRVIGVLPKEEVSRNGTN